MQPKQVLQQWVAAFNGQNIEKLRELYHAEAVSHQVANEPVIGNENIMAMFAAKFKQADIVCLVENMFEDGEWGILEWKDPLGLRGCGFFHIQNNKIIFQRGYWDKLSFLKMHNLPVE